ncbi:MAG: acetate--CoA ligase [Gammaproteobacteria bacterium]|nr:acetate--CoA ligase [Gammaproteobacteria bacterium]
MSDNNYHIHYPLSITQPNVFWAEQARMLDWIKPWDTVCSGSLTEGNSKWFEGGLLNISYNCLDRHLPKHGAKTAIIWESDNPEHSRELSYIELHREVCKFANVLKAHNIKKGDRVCLYMPMTPEAMIAMLACARIGAVHSVVFGGFSPESIANRILDADCKIVITATTGSRGGKKISFKDNVDQALTSCPDVKTVIVVSDNDTPSNWVEGRDIDYSTASASISADCPCEPMAAEDPLFILYTSGSTGKPKGVLHTTAGYLLYVASTHKEVFGLQEDDIYWCTADIGWITGHSYVTYGPLANASTVVTFEGVPSYPDNSRYWQIIDKYKVSIFYTSPTAIRSLMQHGDEPLASTHRRSLRLLGSVGEPINPEAWQWYFESVGHKRCPIIDTWWQTETGGFMIAPPIELHNKPGSAMRPYYGVQPVILDEKGHELSGACEGILAIKASWPGMMRSVYGDHDRFMKSYLKVYPGYYFTGDGAKRDKDGDYWITGRIDDVLNVSGHRIGTAEVESALVLHPDVAEAAVVGVPHDIKGQGIYAYVVLMDGATPSEALKKALNQMVRTQIGPIAHLDTIQFAEALPKTRSGKIMRRILRKIACKETDSLGDISTLSNPESVEKLVKNQPSSTMIGNTL